MKAKPRARFLGKNSRDGFTLVELIVVLVILAILAAFLIPSLTGYIDKARQKQIIVQTRQAVMAAQTLFDEMYAVDPSVFKQDPAIDLLNYIPTGTDKTMDDQICELAELDEKYVISSVNTDNSGRISTLILHMPSKNIVCTYDFANKSEPYTITIN